MVEEENSGGEERFADGGGVEEECLRWRRRSGGEECVADGGGEEEECGPVLYGGLRTWKTALYDSSSVHCVRT